MNKTPEELAKQYAKQDEVVISAINHDAEDLVKAAFVAGYKAAKDIWIWISVKDEYPPKDVFVLFYSQKEGVSEGFWDNDRWYLAAGTISILPSLVTHWMPLPQPPKEDDGQED